MKPFRIFLLNEIFWSYSFGLVLGLLHPTIYFPHAIVKVSGPLNILCTKNGCNLPIEIFFFVAVGYAQALFMMALFRLYRSTPLSFTYPFNDQKRYAVLFVALVGPAIVFVTPIVMARVDTDEVIGVMIAKDVSLMPLLEVKDILVIYNNPKNNDFWTTFLAYLLCVSMVLITLGAIVIMTLITYFTLHQKHIMSKERYKMSIMLLKVLILQVVRCPSSYRIPFPNLPLSSFLLFYS